MTQTYVAVAASDNHKTGRIPTVSRPQWSCPTDCPLMGMGCYGETKPGRPSIFDMVEKSVTRGPKMSMQDLVTRKWRKVPRGIRFGVVGDFLRADGSPDQEYIDETNVTATALPWVAWGYTHAWKRLKASVFKYVVRASTQSREEAEEAIAAGWRTVIVDPGPNAPDTLIGSTISGQKVVQCPATNGKTASCESCLLCGRDVPVVIAFPVHGSGRGKAAAAVRKIRAQ